MYKLTPTASFFEGLGRTMDFDDNLQQYNYSQNPEEADARVIFSDFLFVGSMFRSFIEEYYSHVEEEIEVST